MALTPATTKQQIQYVVIPHPDDELSAWSLIQRSPADYPVFIVLTQGEQTQMGDGRGLQADRGEVIPQPQPFTGRGTPNLRGQRLSSWHGFLDAMSATDPTLDSPADVGSVPSPVGDFRLWIGAATARAVFDLGDGQVPPSGSPPPSRPSGASAPASGWPGSPGSSAPPTGTLTAPML